MIQAAYGLNNKLRLTTMAVPEGETAKDSYTFINVTSPSVIVEALKQVTGLGFVTDYIVH